MLRTANSQFIAPSAVCTARVNIQGELYVIEFFVLPSCSHDVILGWDFLSRHRAIIDCARAEVALTPLQSSVSGPTISDACKLVIAADADVAPNTSTLVALTCPAAPDGAVLFAPSELFLRRHALRLPFAVPAPPLFFSAWANALLGPSSARSASARRCRVVALCK